MKMNKFHIVFVLSILVSHCSFIRGNSYKEFKSKVSLKDTIFDTLSFYIPVISSKQETISQSNMKLILSYDTVYNMIKIKQFVSYPVYDRESLFVNVPTSYFKYEYKKEKEVSDSKEDLVKYRSYYKMIIYIILFVFFVVIFIIFVRFLFRYLIW